ncbi:MAG: primosomal protein N' [Acholeplasmataceae bacterium]|nr:primosomal protein N' [Acholeplasmataceae bacterium]
MYAQVIVDISSKHLNQIYDYKIPFYLEGSIKIGMRVVVDFNHQKRLAYIINLMKTSKVATKEILYTLEDEPTLITSQLKLIKYIQETSFSSYNEAFEVVVPNALQAAYEHYVTIRDLDLVSKHLRHYVKEGVIWLDDLNSEDYKEVKNLIHKGILTKEVEVVNKGGIKFLPAVFLNDFDCRLTSKQTEIVKRIGRETFFVKDLVKEGYSKRIIHTLVSKGVLGLKDIEYYQQEISHYESHEDVITLTNEQSLAIKQIDINKYKRYLLFGPPASGKTEVYLRVIEKVMNIGKQVLILVPEIALIYQMTSRLKERFAEEVLIYHSNLNTQEKYDAYRKTKDGKIKLVVGTRSALFLPLNRLGLIVIDEVHDTSYIQKQMPFYDTKELSYRLGEHYNIPVLMGSATPTISMIYETDLEMIKLLTLSKPIFENKIGIKLIDMKKTPTLKDDFIFSVDLITSIKQRLIQNEQVILLVNRRGYAPFVMCRTCGNVPTCPTCGVNLVYHKEHNLLLCHHCGYKESYSEICKVCKSKQVLPVGFGTEQALESLNKLFPFAKVLRMDLDTTKRKGAYDKMLTEFKKGNYDILLGTQMVSKGHHFENVTLVGVLLAEQMINLNSYLSNETTYNIIKQHIGRLRGVKQGDAIVQTYNPNHFVLKSLETNNFELYYMQELNNRKILKYMPYNQVIKVTFKGLDENKTVNTLTRIKNNIIAKNSQIEILGPTPDYILMDKDRYNYSILLKTLRHFDPSYLMNYLDKRFYKDYLIVIDYYPDMV